jgi:hypothetical protein
MFLSINRNNWTPQHIPRQQALHTTSPPMQPLVPTLSTPHQSFSLSGNICNTILHAAKNKGAGINADSIDLFKALVKQPIPSINQTYITSSILSTKANSHNPSNFTSLMSIYFVYTRIPRTPPSLQATSPTPFETNSHPTFFPTTMRLAFLMAASLS